MNQELFKNIATSYTRNDSKKIGTLSEKTLHAVLKKYFCEDETYHEVKVDKYYADILIDNTIYEVQTRSLNKLRDKLDCFLKDYQVYVCYPIPHLKYMHWINQETGEISEKRKSPKVGKVNDAFFELYKIKQYITNPNFHFKVLLIDMDEYKNLDGWNETKKRGSSRYERIPLELFEEIDFNCPNDYKLFLGDVEETFTNKDLAKALKINVKYATIATNIFNYIGIIEKSGKKGRQILYKKNEPF